MRARREGFGRTFWRTSASFSRADRDVVTTCAVAIVTDARGALWPGEREREKENWPSDRKTWIL